MEPRVATKGTHWGSLRMFDIAIWLGSGAAVLAGALAVVEAALALRARMVRGRFWPWPDMADEPNAFLAEVAHDNDGRRLVDALYPHPYLGFVAHRNPPFGLNNVNNVGLFGTDFPDRPRDDAFYVLVTGGSVACQLAHNRTIGPRYLEDALNRRFRPPKGKRFVVLNGGFPAWKQPQQAILFQLFADVIDGVVCLDGFNEHYMLGINRRFEYPAGSFHLVNPMTQGGGMAFAAAGLGRLARRALWAVPGLRRSHVVAALSAALREARAAIGREKKATPPTTVESLFDRATPLNPAQYRDLALNAQRKHAAAIFGLATLVKVKSAFFLQPVPAIDKVLTEDEKRVVGPLEYRDAYLAIVRNMLGLRGAGVPVFSLTDLFRDVAETVYADWGHLVRDRETGESRPYAMMAERVAENLGAAWNLAPSHN